MQLFGRVLQDNNPALERRPNDKLQRGRRESLQKQRVPEPTTTGKNHEWNSSTRLRLISARSSSPVPNLRASCPGRSFCRATSSATSPWMTVKFHSGFYSVVDATYLGMLLIRSV